MGYCIVYVFRHDPCEQVLQVQDIAAMDKEQIKELASLMRDSQKTVHPITTTSLAERINQIEANITDVGFVIRNQKLLNEEYVELVKKMINQQVVSPHIGSNSPKTGKTTMTKGTIGKNGATLRTRYGSTPAPKGETPRGGRKVFNSESISRVGRSKGEKTHISSSSIPTVQYAKQQNFLQIRHVDRSQWRKEIGKNISRGMPLTFFPTKDVKIVGLDLCVAAYIFNTKLDQEGALRTLEPRKPMVSDVLILLAYMLAENSTRIHWFLPTTFSQIATKRESIPHATLKAIREDFMGQANQIYYPIWCDGHWFLLVIDVIRRQLVYLDSLPSKDDRPKWLWQLKKVAIFLEEVLDSVNWYDNLTILGFCVVTTKIRSLSNDCGMYVAQWMIMYHLWNPYETEKITEYSRMRFAVDMVLKYHNDKRMEVIQAALEY
ncbi:Ulp1 protease family, carboxy-terminal domain protein [Arachis hypogaea]|nr:Ulp1 protease family, carboxy-terminal domain protein [Arachis hypogaea]